MRLVYTDEAGIAPREPVRVVAGVIVEADQQLSLIEKELSLVLSHYLPKRLKPCFSFHASDVMSGKGNAGKIDWPLQERVDLIKAVVSLPRATSAPIAMACSYANTYPKSFKPEKMRLHEFEHYMTYQSCLERADLYLRRNLAGAERGAVISEDTHMRNILLRAFHAGKIPYYMPAEHFIPSDYLTQENLKDHVYELTCLINEPLFMRKGRAPVCDIADACAYSFRRWLAGHDHASDLIYCMLGEQVAHYLLTDKVWTTAPSSSGIFDHCPRVL